MKRRSLSSVASVALAVSCSQAFSGYDTSVHRTSLNVGKKGVSSNCVGIAANYPADTDIATDPDVIFAENFESSMADITSHFTSVQGTGQITLTSDIPIDSGGSQSIKMTSVGRGANWEYLYKTFPDNNDSEIYLRYYTKHTERATYHHAGAWIGGANPLTNYPPPLAGRPNGRDRFSVAAEIHNPYSYHHPALAQQRFDFYNYFANQFGAYGNSLIAPPYSYTPFEIEYRPNAEWMSVEIRIQLNDVGAPNGEADLWVNGDAFHTHLEQGSPRGQWWQGQEVFTQLQNGNPFPGFQWRTDPNLKFGWLLIQNYIAGGGPWDAGEEVPIQYDDLVVARRRIGPLCPGP